MRAKPRFVRPHSGFGNYVPLRRSTGRHNEGVFVSVATIVEFDGATFSEEQYWAVTDKLGLRNKLPEGCEYHIAGFDPAKGLRICESWNSEEAFVKFSREILAPACQEAGIPAPSKVTVMPLIRHTA